MQSNVRGGVNNLVLYLFHGKWHHMHDHSSNQQLYRHLSSGFMRSGFTDKFIERKSSQAKLQPNKYINRIC